MTNAAESAFLSSDDLRTLTGYVRASKQAAALARSGIPFRLNAKGKPVVARDDLTTKKPIPELGVVT